MAIKVPSREQLLITESTNLVSISGRLLLVIIFLIVKLVYELSSFLEMFRQRIAEDVKYQSLPYIDPFGVLIL
jgi:hypothetical protein